MHTSFDDSSSNFQNKKKDKSGGGVGGSGKTPNGDGVNEVWPLTPFVLFPF